MTKETSELTQSHSTVQIGMLATLCLSVNVQYCVDNVNYFHFQFNLSYFFENLN